MGTEIHAKSFTADDYQRFADKLAAETDYLRQLLSQPHQWDQQTHCMGYELEICLVDDKGSPMPVNEAVLRGLPSGAFTHELAKFNVELNGTPIVVHPQAITRLNQDLRHHWQQLQQAASTVNAFPVTAGCLPSLRPAHFERTYMSKSDRYDMVNHQVMQLRQRPNGFELSNGDGEVFAHYRDDIMCEALGTSLQVHWQMPQSQAVDAYHASLWASALVMGFSTNSAWVMNHACWQESRIGIFEQTIDVRSSQAIQMGEAKRVYLAQGYIHTWQDFLDENQRFVPILPELQEGSIHALKHWHLHNGTIWRWVRPIIGGSDADGWHTRLEFRALPAGPSVVDTQDNVWALLGLSWYLTEQAKTQSTILTQVPFCQLRDGFYQAAKQGLGAEVTWCDGQTYRLKDLALQSLSWIEQGLLSKDLVAADVATVCQRLRQRIESDLTGADWQHQFMANHSDSQRMTQVTMQHQWQPGHLWPL